MFTEQELEGRRKGYWKAWTEYTDIDSCRFILPAAERAKLEEWCKPYLLVGIECSGAFHWHIDGANAVIDRVYINGGRSVFLQTTCTADSEFMLNQMQKDYPDLSGFMSDRIGWWHLHPGYFGLPIFSVGDVEETRIGLREVVADNDLRVMNLLVYGSKDTGAFDIAGFAVSLDDVFRYKVTST